MYSESHVIYRMLLNQGNVTHDPIYLFVVCAYYKCNHIEHIKISNILKVLHVISHFAVTYMIILFLLRQIHELKPLCLPLINTYFNDILVIWIVWLKQLEKLKRQLAEAEAALEARKKPPEDAGPRVIGEGLVIDEWVNFSLLSTFISF